MEYIVVGCGRVGSELAYRLFQRGHRVSVIDSRVESFANLPAEFRGRTLEGEALNYDVLRRAGIEKANGLAAVASKDSLNIVVAHIARDIFHVPNVVVRNYDGQYRPLHEVFGLQSISSTHWGAQRMEELLYHQRLRTVFSAGNGEVEVYEFSVPADWAGHRLSELLITGQAIPVGLTRSGQSILPDVETTLEAGDVVLVSATLDGSQELQNRLHLNEEA